MRTDFICRVRYRNTLPPIPFAPKLLAIPALTEKHVRCESTSNLADRTLYSLHTDPAFAVPFDNAVVEYINEMETNHEEATRIVEEIAEEDKILLTSPPEENKEKRPSTKPNVTWLRRSEYIAADTRTSTVRREAMEHQFAMSGRKATFNYQDYITREGQVKGVEDTFRQPDLGSLWHPKTKAKAKRIIPLLPDMMCWENIYTIGQFNQDPSDDRRQTKRRRQESKDPQQTEAVDRGILRPIANPHDPSDNYLIWFLPDEDASRRLKKQKSSHASLGSEVGLESGIDQFEILTHSNMKPLNFEAVRDYTYNNDNAPQHQHMLITVRDDGEGAAAHYNLLKSRMVAQKKRAMGAEAKKYLPEDDYEKPNVLTVTYE
ncbi:RNA polymerase-associated factor [Apophysomyces ossiformis]|uniref:RNA polymerase-associated factor n=1 Tax=Apophysomyces ossiformis TaxID=679940 RepID=A0A8H7BRJ6_9FUNG|nr:RNA polymerase-associated factor [Apophysomyces ossiformis]